jgi:hypothetical protein
MRVLHADVFVPNGRMVRDKGGHELLARAVVEHLEQSTRKDYLKSMNKTTATFDFRNPVLTTTSTPRLRSRSSSPINV